MLNINRKAAAARAVFTMIWRELRIIVDQQPQATAALRCWAQTRLLLINKQTNEFAAHEQQREAAVHKSYPA
jgi:hypothetical protein